MKRFYFYSDDLLNFVEARWIILMCTLIGIILGCVISAAFFTKVPYAENIFRSAAADRMETENIIMKQHINYLSPRIVSLEHQLARLQGQTDTLNNNLFQTVAAGDFLSQRSLEYRTFRSQSQLFASVSVR